VSVQAPELVTPEGPGALVLPVAAVSGSWRATWRRLRRNRAAMSAAVVFVLILFACYPGAPLWVHFVSHLGPNVQNINGTIGSGTHRIPVVANDGTPIGPGLRGQYLLGADANGRDLFVRILYGGRTSLTVGIASALLCTLIAVLLALPAGYFGGVLDRAISRLFDLIWSFPVYLLAVALSAALVIGGLDLGPFHISSSSLLIPIFVIAVVFIPYVARPIRAEVLALREREFVQAAIAHGAGPLRVMAKEILPNVTATMLVLFTLIIANNILVEAALSFLGVGVSVLTPSWGNIIGEGYGTIVTAPWQTIAPGLAIMLSAISLNVFGDGLRDALDPHGMGRGGSR
jgi:peptide/nickel transport system permease protein